MYWQVMRKIIFVILFAVLVLPLLVELHYKFSAYLLSIFNIEPSVSYGDTFSSLAACFSGISVLQVLDLLLTSKKEQEKLEKKRNDELILGLRPEIFFHSCSVSTSGGDELRYILFFGVSLETLIYKIEYIFDEGERSSIQDLEGNSSVSKANSFRSAYVLERNKKPECLTLKYIDGRGNQWTRELTANLYKVYVERILPSVTDKVVPILTN
jgi:hypothetical protein